jgi:hypothetical protein
LLALDDICRNLGAIKQVGILSKGGTVVANIGKVQVEICDANKERQIDNINIRGILAVVRQPVLANAARVLS